MDEFYSHYLLEGELGRSVSAMEYIDDIEESNVVLGASSRARSASHSTAAIYSRAHRPVSCHLMRTVDGLTKNARLPGES